MSGELRRLLAVWGNPVTVVRRDGTSQTVRAVFAPSSFLRRRDMKRVVRDWGEIPQGQYCYIGPPEVDLRTADRLEHGGKTYEVRQWEQVCLGGEDLYGWGMAIEIEEETP